MIRFIDLRDQILEGYPKFAWYNTVTDRFFSFKFSQTWATWGEFEKDWKAHSWAHHYPIDRFKRLFKSANEKNPNFLL